MNKSLNKTTLKDQDEDFSKNSKKKKIKKHKNYLRKQETISQSKIKKNPKSGKVKNKDK